MYRFILLSLLLFVSLAATSCAKRSRATVPNAPTPPEQHSSASLTAPKINLNTAPAKELEALPGIGKGLAERIVEHREKYGPFRRAEHLMMVRGISETRFRAVRHLVSRVNPLRQERNVYRSHVFHSFFERSEMLRFRFARYFGNCTPRAINISRRRRENRVEPFPT